MGIFNVRDWIRAGGDGQCGGRGAGAPNQWMSQFSRSNQGAPQMYGAAAVSISNTSRCFDADFHVVSHRWSATTTRLL